MRRARRSPSVNVKWCDMALFDRTNLPPYELMRPTVLDPARATRRVSPVDASEGGARPTGVFGHWVAGARRPLVVRVPTGMAAVLGLAVILTIVLAYWAGQTRGRRSAEISPQDQIGAPYPAGTEAGYGGTVATGNHTAGIPTLSRRLSADTLPGALAQAASTPRHGGQLREKGLNYFVLAHYPVADADRLVVFLRERGVEAAAFKAHNKRLFQVIALRGFRRDNLYGPARQSLEQELRRLGRAWKKQGLGPDFAQTGIYLDLYEGESVEQVIH